MKLLIITQKVDINDPILGFFHGWITEFARNVENVSIICLYEGEHQLPRNVSVYSLGKERGSSRLEYIIRFFFLIWKLRRKYTHVFVHMNQVYVLLGGIFWKISRRTVSLWYVHRAKTLSLWFAEKLANLIFTATPESFGVKSSKLHFVGQAVDIEKFRQSKPEAIAGGPLRIVSVGRITPIKNLEILIRATNVLKTRGHAVYVELVGSTTTKEDEIYEKTLHELVVDLGLTKEVLFVGSIPNHKVPAYYWKSRISLNLCPTGGMDKAILESMAAGVPAIVSNEAFRAYFGEYADDLIFKFKDEVDCADKIEAYIKNENKEEIKNFLLKRVEERSTLSSLIKQVVQILAKTRNE